MHIAEADSFLRAHTRFGAEPLDQAGRDGYVADVARIAAELGVPDPPRTEAELADRISQYRAELRGTAEARAAARFLLLTPPLPLVARAPYGVLAAAATSLLPGLGPRPAPPAAAAADRAHRGPPGRATRLSAVSAGRSAPGDRSRSLARPARGWCPRRAGSPRPRRDRSAECWRERPDVGTGSAAPALRPG